MNRAWVWVILCAVGCSSVDSVETPRPPIESSGGQTSGVQSTGGFVAPPPECQAGEEMSCDCGGRDGKKTCLSTSRYSGCQCPLVDDAGMQKTGLANCDAGVYSGTFTCEYTGMASPFPILVTGPVGFDLQVSERGPAEDCEEFCTDLVISEGSGKLFGVAGLVIAFEAQLSGGLDCTTGEFRAEALGGSFGFPAPLDANDPTGPLTVAQPPVGDFLGGLSGGHNGLAAQAIEGDWSLDEMAFGGTCVGPFTVELE